MRTPVIIAAHNEARLIGKCLGSLDPSRVEPLVITNGCEDGTAEIARSFGVIVIERTEQGKLPAVQHALRRLGDRALDPILYLDADSYPLHARHWHDTMLRGFDDSEIPSARSGPLAYFDGYPLGDATRSVKRFLDVRKARAERRTHFWGSNMVTRLSTAQTLEAVLDLPHIWPGEDRAIELVIQGQGGKSEQITDPRGTVMTSSRNMLGIIHTMSVGLDTARQENLRVYRERAAAGSIPLGKYLRRSKQVSRLR